MAIHKFVLVHKRDVSRMASSKWMTAGLLRPLVRRAGTALRPNFLAHWLAYYRFSPATFCGRDAEPPSLYSCR